MNKVEDLVKEMLSEADLEEIKSEVKSFEEKTSGEIVVSFAKSCKGDPYKRAKKIFDKMELYNTKLRNGTLIILFLKTKNFAVLGDEGIDAVVPDNFWDDVVTEMGELFREDKICEGICRGVNLLGEKLSQYFPYQKDDINELPDDIRYDEE